MPLFHLELLQCLALYQILSNAKQTCRKPSNMRTGFAIENEVRPRQLA